ncbi:hypothetical protein EDB81DRAFT_480738 [Dactylonectria macrodidyma]|uniref:Uncharacterized protein n=1 Tax=Dactylonectria macrodidyma TaxID=307937 RepID=A0A9P9EYM7_9HYPO|nr:hypothetical protein EDB81DRAFT_480738 [Dactylonectria macrodidyma]
MLRTHSVLCNPSLSFAWRCWPALFGCLSLANEGVECNSPQLKLSQGESHDTPRRLGCRSPFLVRLSKAATGLIPSLRASLRSMFVDACFVEISVAHEVPVASPRYVSCCYLSSATPTYNTLEHSGLRCLSCDGSRGPTSTRPRGSRDVLSVSQKQVARAGRLAAYPGGTGDTPDINQ